MNKGVGSFTSTGLDFGVAFTLEDQFSNTAREIENSMDGLDESTAIMAANVETSLNQMRLGMTALVAGGAMLFPFVSNLQNYSDNVESITKANVIFGDSVDHVNDFVLNQAANYGQANQVAREAIGTFGNLFTALGMGKSEAAGLSVNLNKLASDLGSFNNTTNDSAVLALRSGMVGEFERLKRFGIAINADMIKAKALSMGLATKIKGQIDPLIKLQVVYQLIMEQTKNAQGDFLRTIDDYANKTKVTAANWTDFVTTLGAAFMPIALELLNFFTLLAKGLKSFSETSIGMIFMRITIAIGILLVVGGALLLMMGASKFAAFQLTRAFTGTTRAMIIQTMAQKGVIAGLRAMAVAGWAALAPMLPWIIVGGAIAVLFGTIYFAISKSISAFKEMEAHTGFLGFLQRMGGYLVVISQVWSSWDDLTKTFGITDSVHRKLESLGILETALAIGTWVVRVRNFFRGMGIGFSKAWGAIKKIGTAMKPILAAIGRAFNYIGIDVEGTMSSIDAWATAGEVAVYLIITAVTIMAMVWGLAGINALIAMAPVLGILALITAAIYGIYYAVTHWDGWMESLGNWADSTYDAGVNMISNLWEGMKSEMSNLLAWLDESIENTPLLGTIYTIGKVSTKGGAYLGGELYSAATGEENPMPELTPNDFGIQAASFDGTVARNSGVQTSTPNITIPLTVHSSTVLDGDVIHKTITEKNELVNTRN